MERGLQVFHDLIPSSERMRMKCGRSVLDSKGDFSRESCARDRQPHIREGLIFSP